MAYNCVFTSKAFSDLSDILNYISVELANKKVTKDFYIKLEESIEIICSFPYSQPIYQNAFMHASDIRYSKIGNYLMFYSVDKDEKWLPSSVLSIQKWMLRGKYNNSIRQLMVFYLSIK